MLVPQKPIGGTLETQMSERIVTKIGGDRETGCISKDQPAIAGQISILEDTPDTESLPDHKAMAGSPMDPFLNTEIAVFSQSIETECH